MAHEFQQSGCLCAAKRTGRPDLWARTACSFRRAQTVTLLEFMCHSRIVLSVGGSVWYMIRNLRCTVTIDSVLSNSKKQNAFLFTVNAIFLHDYPLTVEHGSTPRLLVQKKTWRDSLPIDMLLSAVSVLVVALRGGAKCEFRTRNKFGITDKIRDSNPITGITWLVSPNT